MSAHSFSAFRIAAAVFFLGASTALVAPAFAQETKSKIKGLELSNDSPIQIESDKLEIKDPESKAIFSGNVKVVQGTTTLQAGSMIVYYKKGGGAISSGNAD